MDDGDTWQSIQLNLPRTSIRGLAIHGDDLVAATFGRGFWILDDITPLRQLTPQVARSRAYLFAPQTAYRMRRQGRDNPLPPEMPAGQNPPDGGIIDYYLGSDAPSPVILEISDDSGNLVRRFSSADSLNEPDPASLFFASYWVRPGMALSAKRGMHRFVWDLRYLSPRGLPLRYSLTEIPHDTLLRSYGPFVLPGHYVIKLTVGEQSQTQSLTIQMDPRIETSAEGLKLQFQLLQSMCRALESGYEALQEIEKLKTALAALQREPAANSLTEPLDSVRHQIDKSAGAFRQANSYLGALLELADSADASPTADLTMNIRKVLDETSGPSYKEWKEFRDQRLPTINVQLRQAGLPELKLDH
jgi:hypothetical protein